MGSSFDRSEKFIIDSYRGRIEIRNHSFNHRYRREITLARVCLGDKPHTNPDGRVLTEPHLHYFKEGFGVRFAIPLPLEFGDPSNLVAIAHSFFEYSNVSDIPLIQLWEELPWN